MNAWFKTPRGEGTGIVHFENGRISEGDSIVTYAGHYETSGDRSTATVVTKRHTEGHETVYGFDDVDRHGRRVVRNHREMHGYCCRSAAADFQGDAYLVLDG